jgi:hypothetical protein
MPCLLFSFVFGFSNEKNSLSQLQEQRVVWTDPINISNTPNNSWFPDMAIDHNGNVHVVWCETTHVEGVGESEQLFYSRLEGDTWLPPNDIVAPPQFVIHRNAIAVSPENNLYMVHRQRLDWGIGFYFSYVQAMDAWTSAAWSPPKLLTLRLHNYAVDLAVDSEGVLHLLFDDAGDPNSEICPGCSDIYYRRSTNGGLRWTEPLNIARTPSGSSRAQMEIDSRGVIHVVWDEGNDTYSSIGGPPVSGVYLFSTDGGLSWSEPINITYPANTNAQLTVGADGAGGVMLAWRSTAHDEFFFQWSEDYAKTWTTPDVIPGMYSRSWPANFDMYDMATDSAGHIHFLVIGRESTEWNATLGLYHIVWDGEAWLEPNRIYYGEGYPEYPKILVSNGNRLHAVWFVRDIQWDLGNYEVWYSESLSDAPVEQLVPTPTETREPTPLVIQTVTSTSEPMATFELTQVINTPVTEYVINTENDQIALVGLSILPTILFLVAVAVGIQIRRRKGL